MKNSKFLVSGCSMLFGTLLLLSYLNFLTVQNGWLALGIIALLFSLFYIGYGVIRLMFEEKLPPMARKACEVAAIGLFPLFMFALFLIVIIQGYNGFGPAGWIIAIFAMLTGLCLPCLYGFYRFGRPDKQLRLITLLAAGLFGIALFLSVLYDANGNAAQLGDLLPAELILDSSFVGLALLILFRKEEPAPAKEEAAPEEPKEETPAPEEPASEEPKAEEGNPWGRDFPEEPAAGEEPNPEEE